MGLWNPTLRKVREGWGSLFRGGVGRQQVPHRAFSPVRNDKILNGLAARLKSWPSRSWRISNPERDGAVESRSSQSARRMGQPWFGVVPACNRFWFSSAPSGLVIVPCFFTHGLRRGLHSFAGSRLESSGFGIVFGGLVVAAGLDGQAGVGLQQVPGFAVGAVFLALAGGGEVEAAVFSSYYVDGD
jgi:hypothetical protein